MNSDWVREVFLRDTEVDDKVITQIVIKLHRGFEIVPAAITDDRNEAEKQLKLMVHKLGVR